MAAEPSPRIQLPGVCAQLVGRSETVDLAVRRWEAARSGSGHLLLLTGEAGIGKTRLIREISEQPAIAARTIEVAAFPSDAEVAGSLLINLSDATRRIGLAEESAELRARLLHEAEGAAGSARRKRLLVGDFTEMLVRILADVPTLLVIEDLHWADELSLDVLERLAAQLRPTRSMVVVSFRSDELYPHSTLRAWRLRLLRQRIAEEVRLRRLDLVDTTRMVHMITGQEPSSSFALALFVRSDGIPLHVEELLAGGSSTSIPETVAEAVIARVSQLDVATRAVLAAASVIGRSFDLDLLVAVARTPTDAVERALRQLAERHLVVAGDDGLSFDFRHALIRDACYNDVPSSVRLELHAAVARNAKETGFGDAWISSHYELAAMPEPAYRHALAAAGDAARVSAHREAAELYLRAERTAPASISPVSRAQLLTGLAAELEAIDDNQGAARRFAAAIELHRELGDEVSAAVLVPRVMAARHLLGESLHERLGFANDALARLDALPQGGPPNVRAELLAALAAAYMLDRRLDESIELGTQAAALSVGPEAITECTDFTTTLGSVLVFAGRMEEGWALLEQGIAKGERDGHELETARGYRLIASSASVVVEYERAERWIAEGLDYTARTERWNDNHYLTAHLAHVRWAEGDWDGSEKAARRALAEGSGGITTRITALFVLGYLALGRMQFADARQHLGEALVLAEGMHELQRTSPALWGLAELALHEGDPGGAVDLCERAFSESARVSDAAYVFPFVVTGTRAHLALKDVPSAREWMERTGRLTRLRGIPGTLPALDHAGGLIGVAEGDWEAGKNMLETAAAGWNDRRRFWEGTFALLDLAHCAGKLRRPREAARLRARVVDRATTAGAVLLQSGTRNGHEGGASPSTAQLTARELEVAHLVASGSTNRQIAERLTISPKTASSHVEHILAKLGVARRAEIAAWVTRLD